jgi:3-isopropylmalate/(R)-2-methylmalate dehydratase small subunit
MSSASLLHPIRGRAHVFGDMVDTDVLAPGAYMKRPVEELAQHCLEALDPEFASRVQPGDVVVGGRAFGIGSSREQAAQALKILGVGCVLATSFARIFYRNALNLGLPVLVLPADASIHPGEEVSVDVQAGLVAVPERTIEWQCAPIPADLCTMLAAGGLIAHLEQRIARGQLTPRR